MDQEAWNQRYRSADLVWGAEPNRFVAEELREIMAKLGLRVVEDMIGRVEHLDVDRAVSHWKLPAIGDSRLPVR